MLAISLKSNVKLSIDKPPWEISVDCSYLKLVDA
jgi:hypothetical protein